MSKRLTLFDMLIAEGSRDPFHHYARALELRSLGRSAEALSALSAITQEFPDYIPSFLIAAQLAAEAVDVARAKAFCDAGIDLARSKSDTHALAELSELRATLPA